MQRGAAAIGPPDDARLGRRPGLDGLRAIAVALVVGFHLRPEVPGGFVGVDVFFVLSGFLITRLLLEEVRRTERIDLVDFYRRRSIRLFPALAAMLVAVAIYNVTWEPVGSRADTRSGLWSTPLYLSNFFDVHGDSAVAHTWSLAVEEHFYLVWPALLCALCILGVSRRGAIRMVLGGIVASATTFALLHRYTSRPIETLAFWSFDRPALVLLIGALGAFVIPLGDRGRALGRAAALASVPATVVLVEVARRAHPNDSVLAYGGYAALAACVVVLMVAVLDWPPAGAALGHPVLVWLGRRSYAVYLWHIPIRNAVYAHPHTFGDPGRDARDLGIAAGALVAAEISHRLVEAPVARWAQRRTAARVARPGRPGVAPVQVGHLQDR